MDIDKSLDEIIAQKGRKKGGVRKRSVFKRKSNAKLPLANKQTPLKSSDAKATPIAPASAKVMVSNLPVDVAERDIKEFFTAKVAPVRRVDLTYNALGKSKGIATILFNNSSAAEKAMQFNGSKIDGVPLRIEYVIDIFKSNNLLNRVQADPTAIAKAVGASSRGRKSRNSAKLRGKNAEISAGVKKPGPKKAGRIMRPKKTAEELDQEMSDYFANKQ